MDKLHVEFSKQYKAVHKLLYKLSGGNMDGISLEIGTTKTSSSSYSKIGLHLWYNDDIVHSFHHYGKLSTKQLLNKIREDWNNQ